MNRAALPIQQMAEAAGKVIFGEMFSAPKDEDPKWVKQTWDRVVTAIEASLTRLPDGDVDKFTRARIRESAFCEAADWHQGEVDRKRACAEKNRTLRAQIATHMVSEAAIRALSSQPLADGCSTKTLNGYVTERDAEVIKGGAQWAVLVHCKQSDIYWMPVTVALPASPGASE